MAIELNKKTSELYISVKADPKSWLDAQAQAQKYLIDHLSVKGFRKGKVPQDIAKKHIAKSDIFSRAVNQVIKDLGNQASKEIGKDLVILDAPSYNVEKINEEELEIKFIYPVYPEFKISNYKDLNIKLESQEVNDQLVDDELKKIQSSKAALKEIDARKIAKKDIVTFDFEGFVDGVPFDGGKASNYQLEIGSGQFIPGFEDQMVGLAKGDKADIEVTFPASYHVEKLKNKLATFKVEIHKISEKVMPKIDDQLAKQVGIKDVTTLIDLKDYIKKGLNEHYRQTSRSKFQREIFDAIIKETDVVIPTQLIVREIKRIEKQFIEQLKQQKMTIAQYLKMTGMDNVKLNSQFKAQAEARLRDAFIFSEIAKIEKIQLSEQDFEDQYKKLAKFYNQSVDGVKGMITKAQMQIPMTNDRVIERLIELNK